MPVPVTVLGVVTFNCIDLSVSSFSCCCLINTLSNSVSKVVGLFVWPVWNTVVLDNGWSPIIVIISPAVVADPKVTVPVPSVFKDTE